MHVRTCALLGVLAFAAVACSADDATAPLFPGGTEPAVPTTSAPATTPEVTGSTASSSTTPATTTPETTTPGDRPPAAHPLDGLTPDELQTFRDVLAADGKLDGTQFPYVGLDPPDKQAVLDWLPGDPMPRAAFAVARRDNRTYEAVVDLVGRRVVSWTERPGAQPGYLNSEFSVAVQAALGDQRLLRGLADRGLGPADVSCLVFAAGAARSPEEVGKRLARVTCYQRGDAVDFFSRPVEGLFATVDLEAGRVLSVTDSGPVPVPTGGPRPDPQRQRPPLTPIGYDTSAGLDVTLDGYGIEWAGWSLRWRGDRRTGVEIADVRFDGGDGPRRVLYEAYLSDLFVPYQDPDPGWAFRTLLDSAEFGLGATLTPLRLGVDCPDHAALLDVTIPDDSGSASIRPGAACVFERPTGNLAWRHSDSSGTGLAEKELVLRFISTIGNYDYIVDDVFGADGTISFHVYAAGIVLQQGVDGTGVDEHGVLVGDGLLATNHDHYMSFRLDLDVGETANRLVRQRMVPEAVSGDPGRTSIWRLQQDVVPSELAARWTPDPQQPDRLVVEAATPDGPAGHRPGYSIDPGDAVAVAPGDVADEPGMRRGGWAEHTVWVTPYDTSQRFASGLYVPDGTAPAGLPAWTAADRRLVDTDLVVWFTVGFHHVVRTEDLPTMPAHEAGFRLVPENVYPSNPFLDLAPA